MDSVIEIQRSHHEERERIIAAIVVENMEKKTSHREQVNRFSSNLQPLYDGVLSLSPQGGVREPLPTVRLSVRGQPIMTPAQ